MNLNILDGHGGVRFDGHGDERDNKHVSETKCVCEVFVYTPRSRLSTIRQGVLMPLVKMCHLLIGGGCPFGIDA